MKRFGGSKVLIQMKVSLSVFRKRIMWCCVTIVGVLALIVMHMLWARRGYRVDYGLQSYTNIEDSWNYEDGSPAAEVIEESFGAFGRAYRIGGDEFCVLIDTNAIEVYDRAVDLFRKRIENVNKSGQYIFQLQIAHGFICCGADSMKTVEDAIKTADERMYRNKVQLKKM